MHLVSSESILFYNGNDPLGKKTRAYAEGYAGKLNFQDLSQTVLSTTTLRVILEALKLPAKDLMNKAHPEYKAHIRGMELDDEGWLNVLKKNPYLIKWPIVFHGGHVYLCQTPNDVFKK